MLNDATPKLAERLAKRLSTAVHEGQLTAGTRLPTEQALCEQYGVSRTVVREAISMLKREGMLTSRQGSGTFVVPNPSVALRLSPPQGNFEAVVEILELRSALEIKAAELAAARRTNAQLRAMRNALAELDEAVERGEDGVREDLAFHRSVVAATGNQHFLETIDFLHQLVQQAISVTRRNEARNARYMHQVDREHHALLDAIDAGDSEAARRAASTHLHNAEARLREAQSEADISL
ncbi:FadR/GntR family transcriptional regulator [Stutzerimonas azotifigens]|uniref:FadR family transcriptional regulator n=1 Tax=Stutzerimonas azotifigens TaxID=291995 RepID=A0ABR5YYC1_9GAMM|nr:FadR/GntR family transcriptional regulator [Stutzerimonas azotifigens]MBA1272952.1 FadR family transcriptional regulator [Stutzerimonas azotifigens]